MTIFGALLTIGEIVIASLELEERMIMEDGVMVLLLEEDGIVLQSTYKSPVSGKGTKTYAKAKLDFIHLGSVSQGIGQAFQQITGNFHHLGW
ncbi:MAG: hypothetical protein PUP91_37215 [Rhizonema sp. PD37]|nr:hypothetical protein [Rhizonema sp. PD37]